MTAAAVVVGIFAGATAISSYMDGGISGRVAYNGIISIVCLIGAGVNKRVYLADCGVVRDISWWGRRVRRILWWDEVTRVSIAKRGRVMMAFFEQGESGWKVPFRPDEERVVLDIVKDMIPDVEVEHLV